MMAHLQPMMRVLALELSPTSRLSKGKQTFQNLQLPCVSATSFSLVPRPRHAFRRLQYGSDGKLGGTWV